MSKYLRIISFLCICLGNNKIDKIERDIVWDINKNANSYSANKRLANTILYSGAIIAPLSGNLAPESVKPENIMVPVAAVFSFFYFKKLLELNGFSWVKNSNYKKDDFASNNIDSVDYFNLYVDQLAIFAASSAMSEYNKRKKYYFLNVVPKYIIAGIILTSAPMELGWMVAYYALYSSIKGINSWNYFNSFHKRNGYTKNDAKEYKERFLTTYDKEVKRLINENNINVSGDNFKKIFKNMKLIGCVYLAIIIQIAYDSIVLG